MILREANPPAEHSMGEAGTAAGVSLPPALAPASATGLFVVMASWFSYATLSAVKVLFAQP